MQLNKKSWCKKYCYELDEHAFEFKRGTISTEFENSVRFAGAHMQAPF